jgi:UDP-N-acetylenolpyruvoylglucosamine reductase
VRWPRASGAAADAAMVFVPDFDAARDRAIPLRERTSLGVGGQAELWFEPETPEEAALVVRACRERGVPLRPLGGGFNLLVGDSPVAGAVLSTRRLTHFVVHEDRVAVGAGRSFVDLVRRSMALRIPALPGCPGIPGSVGGVVFMNAGGRFGSVAEALLEVSGLDAAGEPFRRSVSAAEFGYRQSPFAGCLITGAVFARDHDLDPAALQHRHDEALAWKRRTQPLGAKSAGCIFKNPDGPGGSRPAGRLIEEAGLKGLAVGGAQVSVLHANFIVNTGGATSEHVLELIERVRAGVRERHGVDLDLEVCRWP